MHGESVNGMDGSTNTSPSSSSTFTELQPAAVYSSLPSIDTLSGNKCYF